MAMTITTYDFSDLNVVVIGASRAGIGAAIARAFQIARAKVTITGLEDVPITEKGDQFSYVKLDVQNLNAVEDFATSQSKTDVLINCAAVTSRGEELEPKTFDKVLDINLNGSFRTAKAFHKQLSSSNGVLINIASMYAYFGSPRNPAYGASKAAIVQLTKSLSILWAKDDIRVNAIAPGFIITEQSERARQDSSFTENVIARTPMGRWGTPDDIVGAAMFLSSNAANFITGTCIPVDGGYSIV
jgi:NAD(P)-dependent dehydrogenase (short-subunit alcohol dehydrogenase family)